MIESIEWLHLFMLENPSIGYMTVFFGAAFLGESILFVFGFLATQGVISISPFIFLTFLGTLFSNTIWFVLGKTMFVSRIVSHRYASEALSSVTQAVYYVSKKNHFWALVIAKFLFGTPFILMLYVHKTNLALKTFLFYETLVILLWLSVIIPVSLLSGLGFIYFAEIFQNLYTAVGLILLIVITVIATQIWVKRTLTKKINVNLP